MFELGAQRVDIHVLIQAGIVRPSDGLAAGDCAREPAAQDIYDERLQDSGVLDLQANDPSRQVGSLRWGSC